MERHHDVMERKAGCSALAAVLSFTETLADAGGHGKWGLALYDAKRYMRLVRACVRMCVLCVNCVHACLGHGKWGLALYDAKRYRVFKCAFILSMCMPACLNESEDCLMELSFSCNMHFLTRDSSLTCSLRTLLPNAPSTCSLLAWTPPLPSPCMA